MTTEEAIKKSKEIKANKIQELKDSCIDEILSQIKEIEEKIVLAVGKGEFKVEIFRGKNSLAEYRGELINKKEYILEEVIKHFEGNGCNKNKGMTDVLSYFPTDIIYLTW